MFASPLLPLSQMNPAQMRAIHDHLAAERGQPKAKRAADRCALGYGIAILRTMRPVVTPTKVKSKTPAPVVDKRLNRPAILRNIVLEELARVVKYTNEAGSTYDADVFEANNYPGEWFSVGLTYSDIVANVRKRMPGSKLSANKVRHIAHMARFSEEGFEAVLPERRPYSKRGKTK